MGDSPASTSQGFNWNSQIKEFKMLTEEVKHADFEKDGIVNLF